MYPKEAPARLAAIVRGGTRALDLTVLRMG
jgi:hypothetical protein